MKECEMCGRSADLVKARIEDTVLSVCKRCCSLGTKLEEQTATAAPKPLSTIKINELVPDFASRIKEARASAGMTKPDLAKKIGVSATVLSRIEKGMRPEDALTRKLEKELKIALFYTETTSAIKAEQLPEMTLGDVVALRIRRK